MQVAKGHILMGHEDFRKLFGQKSSISDWNTVCCLSHYYYDLCLPMWNQNNVFCNLLSHDSILLSFFVALLWICLNVFKARCRLTFTSGSFIYKLNEIDPRIKLSNTIYFTFPFFCRFPLTIVGNVCIYVCVCVWKCLTILLNFNLKNNLFSLLIYSIETTIKYY